MMLPPVGRLLRFLFRDRDFVDLMDVLSSLWLSLLWPYIAQKKRVSILGLAMIGD
jgi:hypothetical protein